jgi:hypothetical protein
MAASAMTAGGHARVLSGGHQIPTLGHDVLQVPEAEPTAAGAVTSFCEPRRK